MICAMYFGGWKDRRRWCSRSWSRSGLGIAANVFIFTAVNRLVLQAPPVGHPETLLDLHPMYDHGQRLGEVLAFDV